MILYLNCQDNPITLNKKNYLLRAAERLCIGFVQNLPNNVSPEYVLNIEPYNFRKGSKWTGVWEIDLLCDRADAGPMWSECDVVYLAGKAIPERLPRENTRLLFQACDTQFHKRNMNIKQEYDVVFCGQMSYPWYKERDRLLSLIKDRYTYYQFANNVGIEQYVNHQSTAKVQFIRSMGTTIADGELAQRFFECLAIGPVLTNYVPDLEYLGLVEGIDYLSYKNDEEMFQKLDYLLRDEGIRLRIAENGQKKALQFHTYEHRLIQILNDIYNNSH